MIRRLAMCAAACAVLSAGSKARADQSLSELADIRRFARQLLDSLQEANANANVNKPPSKVDITWKARSVASLALGAPLLDLEARDVDGDGKAELIMLTTRELIIVARPRRRKLTIVGRIALPVELPDVKSRDPVGVLSVRTRSDGGMVIAARTSEQRLGGVYQWQDGKLVELETFDRFPLCGRGAVSLSRGKNYFEATGTDKTGLSSSYAARCSHGLVNELGAPINVFAILGTDRILRVSCTTADGTCAPGAATDKEYANSGIAFAVADIDNDGNPEVIRSRGQAPGEPDLVFVHSSSNKRAFSKAFQGGVVGLAAGDIDGDGVMEVVAAVRLLGARRIGVWTLN